MDLVSSEARRGGTRGGKNQFNWESVKEDKHRENYLGHSLRASVGRWQHGRDLQWFNKGKNGGDEKKDNADRVRRLREEREEIKRKEKAMMEMAVAKGGNLSGTVKDMGGIEPVEPREQQNDEQYEEDEAKRKEERKRRKEERRRIRQEREERRSKRAKRS